MAAVIVAFMLPSIPVTVDSGNGVPTMCRCGCGNPEGRCCCTAPRTSQLALGCAEREDPTQPIDTASGGKIIGPPEPIDLSHPMPALADLADLEVDFSELDPRPEVPPPRV
ncbi:MAG: hypothetical protein E4H44_06075 [Candidatus Aminicenantes bacterium]|nr:MAG: hypothetical protein E4H44_06075 [Candidatus Aminicenantes bacterium]